MENIKYAMSTIKNEEPIMIGTIGRICYQKNSTFIVDIVAELKRREMNFKFLWIGKGEDEKK